jgi:CBS domain-containing protein
MYDVEYDHRGRAEPGVWRRGHYQQRRHDSEVISAAEIMTLSPEFVSRHTSLAEVSRLMDKLDVGIVPVVEANGTGRLIGVITDRDIAVRAVAHGVTSSAPVGEFMSERVQTVYPDTPLREVILTMSRGRVRRLPVVDRGGRLVGIISQADLAVDYARFDADREKEVEEMIERISEPGHPRRQKTPDTETRMSQRSRRWEPYSYW